jgi:hypothetical protein
MLSPIQVILSEYVLETLVVIVDLTTMSNEIVPPYLKSMHHCSMLKIMCRVVFFMFP